MFIIGDIQKDSYRFLTLKMSCTRSGLLCRLVFFCEVLDQLHLTYIAQSAYILYR